MKPPVTPADEPQERTRERTAERLVRTVRQYGPDGYSVSKIETVVVEIVWPDGKPEGSRNYVDCGSWQLAEEVEGGD